MKCPVCEERIDNTLQKCPKCGFADLRTEFINENELEMWQTYVVYPCRFAYQTFIELHRKFQIELSAMKKTYKELQGSGSAANNVPPSFKKPVLHKEDGWHTEGSITYKTFNECYWHGQKITKCEITNMTLDVVGNKVTVHFFAKKVLDKKGDDATTTIGFKWKLKDDYGIVVADGLWNNQFLNVGDITKGSISISGLDPSVKYVLELVNDT